MNRCFLIKAIDDLYGEIYLADVGENTCFNPDIDDAYVFDNHTEVMKVMDELKHNFPKYSFRLVVK